MYLISPGNLLNIFPNIAYILGHLLLDWKWLGQYGHYYSVMYHSYATSNYSWRHQAFSFPPWKTKRCTMMTMLVSFQPPFKNKLKITKILQFSNKTLRWALSDKMTKSGLDIGSYDLIAKDLCLCSCWSNVSTLKYDGIISTQLQCQLCNNRYLVIVSICWGMNSSQDFLDVS